MNEKFWQATPLVYMVKIHWKLRGERFLCSWPQFPSGSSTKMSCGQRGSEWVLAQMLQNLAFIIGFQLIFGNRCFLIYPLPLKQFPQTLNVFLLFIYLFLLIDHLYLFHWGVGPWRTSGSPEQNSLRSSQCGFIFYFLND